MLALTEATTITLAVVVSIVSLGAFVLLRTVVARGPRPWRWKRIRIGVFVEREREEPDDEKADGRPS